MVVKVTVLGQIAADQNQRSARLEQLQASRSWAAIRKEEKVPTIKLSLKLKGIPQKDLAILLIPGGSRGLALVGVTTVMRLVWVPTSTIVARNLAVGRRASRVGL
ncbi:hypothetical protein L1887_14351 [Cichorium endivia]|nr:hypothetical protein L1887_14351 [Cichorium endivia]